MDYDFGEEVTNIFWTFIVCSLIHILFTLQPYKLGGFIPILTVKKIYTRELQILKKFCFFFPKFR